MYVGCVYQSHTETGHAATFPKTFAQAVSVSDFDPESNLRATCPNAVYEQSCFAGAGRAKRLE